MSSTCMVAKVIFRNILFSRIVSYGSAQRLLKSLSRGLAIKPLYHGIRRSIRDFDISRLERGLDFEELHHKDVTFGHLRQGLPTGGIGFVMLLLQKCYRGSGSLVGCC